MRAPRGKGKAWEELPGMVQCIPLCDVCNTEAGCGAAVLHIDKVNTLLNSSAFNKWEVRPTIPLRARSAIRDPDLPHGARFA
eukprot:1865823-Rhodomonas_salina.3